MKNRTLKSLWLFVALGLGAVRGDALSLFVMEDGQWNAATGEFTHDGGTPWQGVVASFPPVELAGVGDRVHVRFTWLGGSAHNNSPQRIVYGLFQGEPVTGNRQTAVTDAWTGYFHAIGTRSSSSGGVTFGLYRQGHGPQPLLDRNKNWAGSQGDRPNVDGAGTVVNRGNRPFIHHERETQVEITATRTGPDEITFVTAFDTPRNDGEESGESSYHRWEASSRNHRAEILSTHRISDGAPAVISGLGLAGSHTGFTVRDLEVQGASGVLAPAVASATPTTDRPDDDEFIFVQDRLRVPYNALAIDVEVARRGGVRDAGRVGVRTRDGSARANTDFVPLDTVLHWAADESEPHLLRITPLDNPAARGKSFELELHSPQGASLGNPSRIRITFE